MWPFTKKVSTKKKPHYRLKWRKFVDITNCDGSKILYRQYVAMPVLQGTIVHDEFYCYLIDDYDLHIENTSRYLSHFTR